MNYEALNDHLDKKITDFNFKVVGLLFGVLFKPLATATEPFFRKNLGERYFTVTSAMFGTILWFIAANLSKLVAMSAPQPYRHGAGRVTESLVEFNAGDFLAMAMCGAFFGFASANIGLAWQRQKKGIVWHSLSRGQSLWGIESAWLDFGISVVAAFVLLKFALFTGLLFVASRLASRYLGHKEQQSIYARYLDAMDAKVEAEHLEVALRDGVAPTITEGIYGPLAERFKGQHRANIARIAACGPIIAGATAQAQVASAQPVVPTPSVASVPATSVAATSKEIISQMVAPIAGVFARGIAAATALFENQPQSAKAPETKTEPPSPNVALPQPQQQAMQAPASATIPATTTALPAAPAKRKSRTKPTAPIAPAPPAKEPENLASQAKLEPQPTIPLQGGQADPVAPTSSKAVDAEPVSQAAGDMVSKTLAYLSIPRLKELFWPTVLVLVFVAIVVGCLALLDKFVFPSPSKVPDQSQAPPLAVTRPAEAKPAAKTENSTAVAQATLEAQKRHEPEKTQAALELQTRLERERILVQVQRTLTSETAELAKFTADCEARLDRNTNRIAGVGRSESRALNQLNDNARQKILKLLQSEEDSLNRSRESLQSLSSNPQSDLRQITNQLATFVAAKDDEHAKITKALDSLDSTISNAPKTTSFFIHK